MRLIKTTGGALAALASKFRLFLLVNLLIASALNVHAQCGMENTAFSPGESISYEMYFKWGIIFKKVGTGSFNIKSTNYNSKQAYHMELLANTNKTADAFYKMRDTLTCIMSTRLEPLYYRKGADEGDRYTVDEVTYSYNNGVSHAKLKRLKKDGDTLESEYEDSRCIFDMISIMGWARSLDSSDFEVGHELHFPLASGKRVEEGTLIYHGKKNVECKDGKTYRTQVFSYVTNRENKKVDVMKFYVSDDANRLPLRLDLSMKFGTAQIYLKGSSGNRYPLTSIVK